MAFNFIFSEGVDHISDDIAIYTDPEIVWLTIYQDKTSKCKSIWSKKENYFFLPVTQLTTGLGNIG